MTLLVVDSVVVVTYTFSSYVYANHHLCRAIKSTLFSFDSLCRCFSPLAVYKICSTLIMLQYILDLYQIHKLNICIKASYRRHKMCKKMFFIFFYFANRLFDAYTPALTTVCTTFARICFARIVKLAISFVCFFSSSSYRFNRLSITTCASLQ